VPGGHLSGGVDSEYLAIAPPRLLSFTWRSPYTGQGPSVVTVSLEPEGGLTRLVLVHQGLPVDAAAPHQQGWGFILTRLDGQLIREVEEERTP
jgi:uncharacterized protein YndB with AHSA1/START domain